MKTVILKIHSPKVSHLRNYANLTLYYNIKVVAPEKEITSLQKELPSVEFIKDQPYTSKMINKCAVKWKNPCNAHLQASALLGDESGWVIDGDLSFSDSGDKVANLLGYIENLSINNPDVLAYSLDIWRSSNTPAWVDHWSLGVVYQTPNFISQIENFTLLNSLPEAQWGTNLDYFADQYRKRNPGTLKTFSPVGFQLNHRGQVHKFLADKKDSPQKSNLPYKKFTDYLIIPE